MSSNHPTWAIGALLPLVLIVLGLAFYYVRYSAIPRERALALWAATVLATGLWVILYLIRSNGRTFLNEEEAVLTFSAMVLCILVAVPFLVRLWSKWVQGNLTEAERSPGAAGWRAWFSGGNIIVALIISFLAWQGFQISLPLMLFATLGALAMYPAILSASETSGSATDHPSRMDDSLADEREKILSMLENGKITAAESAELLNALGATMRRPEADPIAMTSAQRLVLVGAGVLLIGFFLPWLVVNPGKELNHMMSQVTTSMQSMMPPGMASQHGIPNFANPTSQALLTPVNMEIQIVGGSIDKGLGWAALGLGLLAALLPYGARAMDYQTQRLMRFLALGGGATIVLYLLTSAPRSIGIGLIVAALGIALEFVGVARERRIA